MFFSEEALKSRNRVHGICHLIVETKFGEGKEEATICVRVGTGGKGNRLGP